MGDEGQYHAANITRGTLIDQSALVVALQGRAIGGALLDVTDPVPLPADHVLWSLDNAHVTMHLLPRAQDQTVARSVQRFLKSPDRFDRSEALKPRFVPARGID